VSRPWGGGHGRLAATARPEQRDKFARFYPEIQAVGAGSGGDSRRVGAVPPKACCGALAVGGLFGFRRFYFSLARSVSRSREKEVLSPMNLISPFPKCVNDTPFERGVDVNVVTVEHGGYWLTELGEDVCWNKLIHLLL
jgi:hypothetical protein